MSENSMDLKPLFEGIFGKQRTEIYKRPVFKERDLMEMLRDLAKIPLLSWDCYAFSRDPLNGKVSPEKRREYMKKAWECGEKWADKSKLKYGDLSPKSLAAAMGMDVAYPDMPESMDRVLFAEFREPNHINIYMDAINKAVTWDISEVIGDADIADILLLHELFHSIEEVNKREIYTRTEKIKLWSIGFIKYKSGLVALSEIAAMGFAYRYSGIDFSPYLFDVILVYGYSENEASGLYEEMMELAYERSEE